MEESLLYKDEVYSLVGCAMEVYNELKPGYLEAVYQEALEIVMRQKEIHFESQKPVIIYFQGKPLEKRYVADLVVDNKILVELKSKKKLEKEDEAQLLNYLRGTHLQVGVLMNFGHSKRLEWKRYALTTTYNLVESSYNVASDEEFE